MKINVFYFTFLVIIVTMLATAPLSVKAQDSWTEIARGTVNISGSGWIKIPVDVTHYESGNLKFGISAESGRGISRTGGKCWSRLQFSPESAFDPSYLGQRLPPGQYASVLQNFSKPTKFIFGIFPSCDPKDTPTRAEYVVYLKNGKKNNAPFQASNDNCSVGNPNQVQSLFAEVDMDIAERNRFSQKVLKNNGFLPISFRQILTEDSSSFIRKYPVSPKGHHYFTLNSLGKLNISPQQIINFIKRDPKIVFPYFDAKGSDGQSLVVGNSYLLFLSADGLVLTENRVKVIQDTPLYFTLEAVPGEHQLRGTATHGVFKDCTGELWLFHEGFGVENESEFLQKFNYLAADYMWSKMADNIRKYASTHLSK